MLPMLPLFLRRNRRKTDRRKTDRRINLTLFSKREASNMGGWKSFQRAFRAFVNKWIVPSFKDEVALLAVIMADVNSEGLKDDEARKEVQRRFRQEWKKPIKDSILNYLIESLVMNLKVDF
jgi:hypothetical protein